MGEERNGEGLTRLYFFDIQKLDLMNYESLKTEGAEK